MKENRFRLPGCDLPARGFTLVELLVVIAIIAMLVTAILPAVQAMRTSARRAQCNHHVLQIIMAAQNYEMAHEHFPAGVTDPAGGPIHSIAKGHHHGWVISLLPYLDESSAHRNINFEVSVYDAANQRVRELTVPRLVCPMEPTGSGDGGSSSYAACHNGGEAPIDTDNRGVFFLNSRIMIDDVRDGLASTIFFGEKSLDADDLGWMSGTRATLRNTGTAINSGRVPKQIVRDSDDPIRETGYSSGYGGYGGGYGDDAGYGGYADDEEEEEDADGDEGDAGNEPEEEGDTEDNQEDDDEQEATQTDSEPQKTDLHVGGFSSFHPNGAHVAFGDGRIQFMTPQIDPRIYQLLGDRDDGTLLDAADYRD